MDLRSVFTENFNKLLATSPHTLADVSRYMGVSTATTTDWKKGRIMPRIDKINKLAVFFQVPPSVLLGVDQLPDPEPVKTDLLDALFSDSPEMLSKLRNVTIEGKLHEPGVLAQLTPKQKERIKDIILLTYEEAVRNGGHAEAYTVPTT